ncbi:MAG: DegT/DnrJ/EryC1/StrS family aminotransferase [Bacteroidales bacterium]
MDKIQMVDLHKQYLHIRKDIDTAIQEVIDQSAFINGKAVKDFQEDLQNYLGVNHVIPCANGTDALQIALMALGLEPGDEIIAPDFTFIATVEVVCLLGLKLVVADVDPDTFNLSPAAVEAAITPRTRAIVPVHLFGQCANMDELVAIADKHRITIIEDLAQANGAQYIFRNGEKRMAGTMGRVGCTSFFPSKNLGCFGDGGALMTNDERLAATIRSIANHGMKVRYHHDTIGVNSRLDTIQAAVLKVKLRHLDAYNLARQQVAHFYDKAFSGNPHLLVPYRNPASTHIFHQYTLRIRNADRDGLKEHLEKKGIPSMVYYPVPLHLQKAYEHLGYREGDFPVTEQLCKSVLSLPMHTELDQEQLEYITGSVLEYFN